MMAEDRPVSVGKDDVGTSTKADPLPSAKPSIDEEVALQDDEELAKVERVYRKIDRRIIPRE